MLNIHTNTHIYNYFKTPFGTVLCTELPTEYHHNSRIELSVRWCVWKVGGGFPIRVLPKTLKWVAMYFSVTFHISG